MISYRLGDIDGILVISFLIETPFTTLRVALKKKGFEFSSSEDWSSCMYDSYVWKPSDDMVTNLFFPFEDDLSQHTQG
jgi:hypothetical protein